MSVNFKWDSREIDKNLAELPPKVRERIRGRVRRAATRAELEMKAKAPWTETGAVNIWGRRSTGEARDGLYAIPGVATTEGNISRFGINFGNSSGHGIWLEIAMNGRYQIIMPTLKATGDALMASMTDLLGRAEAAGEIADFSPEVGRPGTSQGAEVTAGRYTFRLKNANRTNVNRAIRRRRNFGMGGGSLL